LPHDSSFCVNKCCLRARNERWKGKEKRKDLGSEGGKGLD
jgi:hypothetical protein